MSITAAGPQANPQRLRLFEPSSSTALTRPWPPIRPGQVGTSDPNVWHMVWKVKASAIRVLEISDESDTEEQSAKATTESGTVTRLAEVTESALDNELDNILAAAQHEEFEEGMCSELERRLKAFVGDYEEAAVIALHDRLQRGLKRDVMLEVLGSLGRMRVRKTRHVRLAMLATWLGYNSAAVRDAAGRALLDLEDVRARRFLERAAAAEENALLKASLAELATLVS